MALFFLGPFSSKAHLHDKQRHFEAACGIGAALSLTPDLLLLFLSTVILFFVSVSLSASILFIYL